MSEVVKITLRSDFEMGKGHVAEENITEYRKLKNIADKFDDLGNTISDIQDSALCWTKAMKYNAKAMALREDIPSPFTSTNHIENGVEWRQIPEFPLFELNVLGQVRERSSKVLLKPRKNTHVFYVIPKNGSSYSRSKNKLVVSLFKKELEQRGGRL